ncbi:MAG: UDP-N-acetylglucosamine 2-epimerase (non-hydrolyzing) [Bacteroidota bacterium]|nr:UDP-N-acetylglucosamine 2-epimerase (non-hydrolyzing) [Bacteroidota bacterium]
MKILSVVAARPNFMKVAAIHKVFIKHPGIESIIVHTGQHYDNKMSQIFFEQLALPVPDYFLDVQPGTATQMTAHILLKFEEVLKIEKPDWVMVVGDVTSTFACALTAVRAGIKVAHVEAGLRSFDRSMPEEINRILTDQISDLLFTTEVSAKENLIKEGISISTIHFTGNCMIDSLIYYMDQSDHSDVLEKLEVTSNDFMLMTMHRPSNVDYKGGLQKIIGIIEALTEEVKIIFPIHPRTKDRLMHFNLFHKLGLINNLIITEPLAYLDFIRLMKHAKLIMTDSGGIQEETTFLNIPCLTFRESTERPVTITHGSNQLLKTLDPKLAIDMAKNIIKGHVKSGSIPELWDGRAAERIVNVLLGLQ